MAFEYYVKGRKISLDRDNYFVAARFAEPSQRSRRAEVARASGCGEFSERIELKHEKFTIFRVPRRKTTRAATRQDVEQRLAGAPDTVRTAPVFRIGENQVLATDRVIVRFTQDNEQNEKMLAAAGLEVIHRDGPRFLVRLKPDECPFRMSERLRAESEIEYAEPDFITIGKRLARVAPMPGAATPRPASIDQYAVRITRAQEAWSLRTGDPTVRIAILDEGVDTEHEDLAAAIAGSYDGVDDDTFQEPNRWDGHGTACAGLAAACHNPDIGIKGVGGGCSLLAVRIAYSRAPGADWITTNSWIARSIDWSWRNGAAVLSNSWGGGAPSSAIIDAFEDARTLGRGGKGCVIVIAAGNASGPVDFPGNLPNVLTVSASNEFDEFKTKTSRDGETWWGSNFGPEVDVAAPGVHNATTDITAGGGYDPGNYTGTFNGTSSATPIVAGAAGLLISANPELTEAQVRDLLRQSADKVGDIPYNDGRNDQMGFGRVNVFEALQRAQPVASGYTTTHSVMRPTPIRDFESSSIQVAVGDTRPIADVKIHVDIEHTYIGDLRVTIEPPPMSGFAPVILHNKTGLGTDDLKETYTVERIPALRSLIGNALPGMWTLRVTDFQAADEGRVNGFTVELQV